MLKLLLTLICLAMVAGYFGQFNWILELFSHFKVYYAAGSLLLLSAFLIYKHPSLVAISAFILAINMAEIIPWYINQTGENDMKNNRFMISNVMKYNDKYNLFIESVKNENPDFLGVLESDRKWLEKTKTIKSFLPYTIEKPRPGRFGMALYSRYPLSNVKLNHFGLRKLLAITANTEIDNKKITIVLVHPSPPVTSYYAKDRNIYLEQLADYVNKISGPKIIIGDFNITMWSPIYKSFMQKTRLTNARKGFGIVPTWPTHFRFIKSMMIPIDHCLLSKEFISRGIKTGNKTGSDHYPVVCNVSFIKN